MLCFITVIQKENSPVFEDLLLQFNLPSLRLRRKLLKLSFFFQIHNGNFHSLGSPVHPSPMDPRLRGYDPARIASLHDASFHSLQVIFFS